MAQSVRRPETLGAINLEAQRDKSRTSYFCNVKSRLGSKLPAGVSQPPQFAKPPWDMQPEAGILQQAAASNQLQNKPIVSRPLNHIPQIRNPKLRQYYLQGTSWDLSNTVVTKEFTGGSLDGFSGDTVFSVSSKFNGKDSSSMEGNKIGQLISHNSTQLNLSPTPMPAELLLRNKNSNGSTTLAQNSDSLLDADLDCETSAAQPQSPSPEAEYDKLLDVEAVPLPDGQLCLLALPPECCDEEGPEAETYLKLFSRYITDRKGVVSGILLVTANKIFFDPCKTHPLVKEHGCEEYLLSCSVDNLASITFFSDISHVHFTNFQQRQRGKNLFQKRKNAKTRLGKLPNQKEKMSAVALSSATSSDLHSTSLTLNKEASGNEESENRDIVEADRDLEIHPEESVGGLAVLSSAATFCCGAQEAINKLNPEFLHTEKSSVNSQTAVPRRPPGGNLRGLMFVRLRLQLPAGKSDEAVHFGLNKTLPRREAWLTLSKESTDELRSYLQLRRPNLCLLEGDEEVETDGDEEGFVLIEDKEEESEDMFQRQHNLVDDWEMVLMEESKEKPIPVIDRDPEGLGTIVEISRILETSHVIELCKELPPRTVGQTWQLAYSTSQHGASLKNLYRKLAATDSPVLMVIKDALDEIFGAFLSHPLRPSEAFYGTGETFLFMLHPRFKCFRWTGENSFFIKGDLDCFAVGGGSGHFGLWVDEDLYLGRSSPCHTFNNCCLAETDDFRIIELEVWTFS